MSTATPADVRAPRPATPVRERLRALRVPAPAPELLALLVLAGVLDLWALDRNGWANTYYSAAVRSMSTSWHAFLYNSFDSAGVMTVDKPPLALWVQALSARAFGWSSWSMLVPQALMGVGTVALAYDLTRRVFGRPAGFVAGLVLATTPITVAISRHNNPDALVVLCSTAALWFTVRALKDGRTRWLLWAGVCVGLGFETKMGTALLVVPALAAAYLWVAPRGRLVAVRQLLAGGAAMTVVGLAWPMLMWLTPASSRPWISGTSDNSIWSLIVGYNGLGRVDGQQGGPGAAGGPGGGGSSVFGGDTGVLRLLGSSLGGQAGWLVGMAAVAGVALVVLTRLRRTDARSGWLIAAGGTFATTAIVFSFAKGIFHPYYVSMLAPFIAVLVGAAVGTVLRGGLAARIVGPAAIAGGVISELIVIHQGAQDVGGLIPIIVVAGVGGAVALALALPAKARAVVVAVALGALLIAPATWATDTLSHATSGTFPAGGPTSQGMGGPGGGGGRGGQGGGRFGGGGPGGAAPQQAPPPAGSSSQQAAPPAGFAMGGGTAPTNRGGGMGGGGMFGSNANLTDALSYAASHGGGTIGVSSQTAASAAIIQSGADVAGLGGFSGRESEVSASWLAQAVQNGTIRYVLTDGTASAGGGNDGRVGSSTIMSIVQKVGKPTSVTGLYDLQGTSAAIAAAGS
ncbi:MAG TPA: glycosyltransferase family 39 protein [Baekduia sp.]|uniref:ArnT family glycosyltransferase n=1 Tax=Baekduia sp. TaxID=2600305 RepID=UPI002BC752B3|nr:glycosyltransferase family 39 protein [Baekduia sp.]HMJ34665.1 glycosyltransferase family 39 protein [Baekduia sp.]